MDPFHPLKKCMDDHGIVMGGEDSEDSEDSENNNSTHTDKDESS
jgi:hypothetical protein